VLIPMEVAILEAAVRLAQEGTDQFYGLALAREIDDPSQSRHLASYGTIYKALDRLKELGYLERTWEDAQFAAAHRRPPRCLYHVTDEGRKALAVTQQPVRRDVDEIKQAAANQDLLAMSRMAPSGP